MEHYGKKIGIYTLTAIGLGGIIGSGIFALPAAMGAVAGPGLIIAILISGLISLIFALGYAELGAAYSLPGGPYAFPRLSMGNFMGFLIGWGYFIYLFVGTAAIIDIFVTYLGFYIPGLAVSGTLTPLGIAIAVAFLWVFTYINILGVQWGGLYSLITTIGKLIPLLIFFLIGLFYFKSGNFSPIIPFGWTGVTIAVTMFFWSYTGFEAIVVPAEEIIKPHKTIPLAMVLTIFITIAVYLLIAIVFVGMLDWQQLGLSFKGWKSLEALSSPLADISKGLKLPWLAAIATVGAIIATGGSGGTWVLIQGRLPYAMAKDHLFWKSMSQLHPRYKSPAKGLILSSILSTLILVAIPHFASVALIASITVIVPYAAAMLALAIQRAKDPQTERPFKLPFVNGFAIIGFVMASVLVYWASWPWTLIGALLLLTGYPAALLVKERKDRPFTDNLWFLVYLVGLTVMSLLGDPQFAFNNFLKIKPLGLFVMPYDYIILTVFSLVIYFWAYRIYTKPTENKG